MATGLFNLKQVNQAISQGAWSGYIAPKWVEYLVVAGGGGAGLSGGGGGGGGLLSGIVTIAPSTSYTVTVGSGGAGGTSVGTAGSSGQNSVFGAITSTGGGGGGSFNSGATTGNSGLSGGSGGGGAGPYTGINPGSAGSGISGQGNAGGASFGTPSQPYTAGGGGGAGTAGRSLDNGYTGPFGGAGIASVISGTVTAYSGGGGGGAPGSAANPNGVGGVGGGGSSSTGGYGGTGQNGSSSLGGGGGGGWGGNGGAGGSGIVVVRYPGNVQFFTGGTLSYANGYMIHTFYASGTLAPTTPTPYVTDYQISRSLRFNSADSAYLNRTPASASNRRTWTWSGWIKLTKNTSQQYFFGGTQDNYNVLWTICSFYQDKIYLQSYSGGFQFNFETTQVFRDYSAWYHIVVAVDTTQATDTNRLKLYVNGNLVTSYVTASYPSQNADTLINGNWPQTISGNIATTYLDAYMTEVNFIDGQALTPSSFGYTDPDTGVWSPLAFVGTYGTNGFYLNFSDNSNTTAATLGKDYSGNGNNWTPNNFSVTAGAGNDSLVDSPTSYGTDTGVGGTVRGNYATLNPLYAGATGISNGNLDVTLSGGTQYGSMSLTTGKWYWEVTPTASLVGSYLGVMDSTYIKTDGSWNQNVSATYVDNGSKYGMGGAGAYGASYTTGDVIGFAIDLDAGTMVFYKNGVSQGTAFTGMTGREWRPMFYATGGTYACNFGQRPFAYTAPSGYKALCTQNLPTPTIGATSTTLANLYFNPVLYTGDRTDRTITVGFQPDWVWVKSRNAVDDHYLMNAVVGTGKYLVSNSTASEVTNANSLTAYTSTGFSVGNTGTTNETGRTYVAWNWRASNATAVTNTAGSITSTVSANTTSGFSIVTYTGSGTSLSTVGHGLGAVPSMVIVKARSASGLSWYVYQKDVGNTKFLELNSSAAPTTFNLWESTTPTSSVFTISNNAAINGSGTTFVAYCFAPVAGYSAFGSYDGNGSTDGPFVYTGFRPAYIMAKSSSNIGSWVIYDAVRNTYNVVGRALYADLTDAEYDTPPRVDFLSNGFKLRSTGEPNNSGRTFIYMAFAEAPLKFSLAR